jgi:hypothetical protein
LSLPKKKEIGAAHVAGLDLLSPIIATEEDSVDYVS